MTTLGLSDLPDARRDGGQWKIDSMQEQYQLHRASISAGPEGTAVYVGRSFSLFFILGCVIVRGNEVVMRQYFSIVLAWGRRAMVFTDIMLSR